MRSFTDMPRGGIVVVNWNGWGDVIECLEAIFHLQQFEGPVIVCDNSSTDGSLTHIRDWANGNLCALPESASPTIRQLVIPPVVKPIAFLEIEADHLLHAKLGSTRLIVVKISSNIGYAAANNLGLKLLESDGGIGWFWLLNSDALPCSDAAIPLTAACRNQSDAVITGSVLLEYWTPTVVQACGAGFNRFLGRSRHHFEGKRFADFRLAGITRQPVDYPVGASLAINRKFLKQVGLMSEDYFLYNEEIDWVVRLGWPSSAFIACNSVCFHKGGKATGAGRSPRNRSLLADYYFLRGRLTLAAKGSPLHFLTVLSISMAALFVRLCRPTPHAFSNALRACFDALRGKVGIKQ